MTERSEGRRSRPQQERSRSTFEEILRAAEGEFVRSGVAGTTTTAIAERAGVSVGALYRFFPDKFSIVTELASRYLATARELYEPIVARADLADDLAGGVDALIGAAAELHRRHFAYFRFTEELRPADPASITHPVRIGLVGLFDGRAADVTSGLDADERRNVVELAVETVRHALATCPDEDAARGRVVAELKAMVGPYVARRLAAKP